MLIIRFSRVGKKNHAQYRIVLAEKLAPVKGKFVELLGSYDPHQKQSVLKENRIKYWIKTGAQCSDSAFNLFVEKGLIEGEKRQVKMPEKKKEESSDGEEKKDSADNKTEVKEDGAKTAEEKSLDNDKKDEVVEEKKPEEKKAEEGEKKPEEKK